MSAIDNAEVSRNVDQKSEDTSLSNVLKSGSSDRSSESITIRKPKRILHFSDGTLEESDESDDDDVENNGVDAPLKKSVAPENQVEPVNPKTLPWSSWIHHYTTTTGQRTLNVLDNIGENIAYYLGITTPKYQYEIDEYNRAKEEAAAKQKEKQEELNSWATPKLSNFNEPIVNESTRNQNQISE